MRIFTVEIWKPNAIVNWHCSTRKSKLNRKWKFGTVGKIDEMFVEILNKWSKLPNWYDFHGFEKIFIFEPKFSLVNFSSTPGRANSTGAARASNCLTANACHDLIQNHDFGQRKIWILERKNRFGGFRHRWFQICRYRNKIREELKISILDFWKLNSGSQMPNSKSWFWGAKFWFWKNRIFKFRQNSCPKYVLSNLKI